MAQQVVVIEPDYFSVEVTAPQTVTISNTGPQGPEGGTSTLTTKGDILGRSATAVARIPVGTDGQMLTADSTNPLGVAWTTPNPGDITGVTVSAPITGGGTSGTVNIGLDQGSITIAQSQVTNLVTDLAAKAPLASPTFTGDPKAPTPTSTDNDTSIATTAFVQAQKASPALTGTPTAPTAPLTTSTTQIATTEFVDEGTVDIRQFAADKSVLDNLPARIHPAEQLLKQAVFWIDSAHSSASGQTITNLGWGGSALNATAGSTGSADSNDPKYLGWDGTNYVYVPGADGNTISTPSTSALNVTSDIDVRVFAALDSWTPSTVKVLAAKSAVASNYSWAFSLAAGSGKLQVYWSTDGTTGAGLVGPKISTVGLGFADGAAKWVRFTLDVDNGASGNDVKFFTSDDGVTWTQLGSTITTAGVTSIFAGTSQVEFGAQNTGSGAAGKYYRGQVLNGINGTPVLDMDTSLVTSGSNTSFTALTGQTVTINRSPSGRKTVAVTTPCWLFGTDDYIEVADNNLLDFGATDSFTVLAVARLWNTAATFARLIAKTAGTTSAGYALTNYATPLTYPNYIGDGTNNITGVTATAFTAGALNAFGLRIDRSVNQASNFLNGTINSTTAISSVGSLANSRALRIGMNLSDGNAVDTEVLAVAIFRRVLTAGEITTLSNYFTGRAA